MNLAELYATFYAAVVTMTLTAWLGWVGVTLIFSAFMLNSHHVLKSSSRLYLAMNIAGSALFGYDLFTKESWSGVTLQTVWILIAISAAMRKKAAG